MRKRPVCSTQSSRNGSRRACSASDSERYAPSTMRQYSRTFAGPLNGRRLIYHCRTQKNRPYITIGPILNPNDTDDLPSFRVLSIQRLTQTREVRVERHKTTRALEERLASSFIRQTIQRTLSVTRCNPAAARQTN